MPYISPVYKDTKNLNQYNSEATKKICLEEEAKGNVPVVFSSSREHIIFYASRDAAIDDILASQQKAVKLCQLSTYSQKNHQYQSPIKIVDTSQRVEQLSLERKIQVVVWVAD